MDGPPDGLVGVGGGGGHLELGGKGEGRLGRAVPCPQICSSHDDDDGR